MLIPHLRLFLFRESSSLPAAIRLLSLAVVFVLLSACSVSESDPESTASKSIPQNIIATAGTRAVSLQWTGVVGSSAYTVYWSNQPGVTQRNSVAIKTTLPKFDHKGLSNGQRYYYVISAIKSSGETSVSNEVSAVPVASVPAAPTSVVADSGAGRVSLRWDTVPGAVRYNVYWSNNPGVTDIATRIDNVVSPLVHSGLQNGSNYYYIVVAENAQGAGAVSIEVSGKPLESTPLAPIITSAVVSADAVEIYWQDVSADANSNTEYDLFWNIQGNVTTADTQILNVTSPYRHAPLSNNQVYYYRLQARNNGGKSSLSNGVQVQPPGVADITVTGTLPSVPTMPSISLGDGQLSLNWPSVSNALAYNLYWTNSANADFSAPNSPSAQITKISNIQSPYTHIQLNNGSNYRYALSAINNVGESGLSAVNSAAPEIIKPGVPAGVYASSGDEWIEVRWVSVEQAREYEVYITHVASGIEQQIIQAVSPQRADATTLNGGAVINDQEYMVEVVAINANPIKERSKAISVTPREPVPQAPGELSAEPGNAEVLLSWLPALAQNPNDLDENVTAYRVYFSKYAQVTTLNGTLIPALNNSGQPNYQTFVDGQGKTKHRLRHTGLSNGQRYYYIVTALNVGGEGRPSPPIWAQPQVPVPTMPNNIWAQAGNNQVIINFTEAVSVGLASYNLYWSKSARNTSGSNRSTTQVITNISPGYLFQDGAEGNKNTYYFRLGTVVAGQESAQSAEVSANPQAPPPSTPQISVALGQQSQVMLAWAPALKADNYVLYWSTDGVIDTTRSARINITGTQLSYVHANLLNGQVIYYRMAAANAGGESALSALATALPRWDAPPKPNNVVVTAGDGEVLVNWPLLSTATSYTLYWDAAPVNAQVTQWAKRNVLPGDRIKGLSNGQRYQFILTANNSGGVSNSSDVVSATPTLSAPTSPINLNAASGDRQVSLNWTTKINESYTLYWTNDSNLGNLAIDSGNVISDVRPTYVHSGLSNGTLYRYQLTASRIDPLNGNIIGPDSTATPEVSATATATVLAAPQVLRALEGDGEIQLSWLPPAIGSGPYTYTLYWSNSAGQGKSGNAIGNLSNASFVHSQLTNNQDYYYSASATTANGTESPLSVETTSTPRASTPAQVTGVWVSPSDARNEVNWQAVAQASQYLVQWSTQVDGNNMLLAPITKVVVVAVGLSKFVHSPLLNGTTIYYRIQAQNKNGVGGSLLSGLVSTTVSGTPQKGNNQVPVIEQGVAQISVTMDEDGTPKAFALNLSATDNDRDSLSWRIGEVATIGSAGVIGNGVSATVTYAPNKNINGQDQFTVLADDGRGGVGSIRVVVDITAQNDPPVFNVRLDDQISQDGKNVLVVDAGATDVDSSSLFYSAIGLPPGLSINNSNGQISGTLLTTASLNSPYAVTVTVDDQDAVANATDRQSFSWVVNAGNAVATFSTASIMPSAASVMAGTEVVITLTARDANGAVISTGGDRIEMTIAGANMRVTSTTALSAIDNNNGTYTLSYTPQLAGNDTYSISLNQNTIAGSYTKTITPAAAAAGNSVAQIPAGPYTVGVAVSLSVQVLDVFGNATDATMGVSFEVAGTSTQTLAGVAQGGGMYTAAYTPTLAQGASITITTTVDGTTMVGSYTRSINATQSILYVSNTALDDSLDGFSVATAKKTISAAIAAATPPASIRVTAGTYLVNSDSQNATHIIMKNGVSLYGGYTADFSQRLPTSQISIIEDISSEVRGSAAAANRAVQISGSISATTIIDGFTIRASKNTRADYSSALVINSGAAATIQNNIIAGGNSSIHSFGIRSAASTPTIQNNKIHGGAGKQISVGLYNDASASIIKYNSINGGTGGSVTGIGDGSFGIQNYNSSNALITNNTIVAGCASNCRESTGIENISSNTIIENNMIYGVGVVSRSIAIRNKDSSPTIQNNSLFGGVGRSTSYGIYSDAESAGTVFTIQNNVIHGGSGAVSFGIYNLMTASPVIRNNIIDGGNATVQASGIANAANATNSEIVNNIIYISAPTNVTAFCIFESSLGFRIKRMLNNSLFSCNTAAYFNLELGCSVTSPCTLARMEQLTGYRGNVAIDPQFIDIDGHDNDITTLEDNDYRFSGLSDTRVTTGGLNGIDDGGWGFNVDKDGATRPVSGVPWAMGAYDTTATYYVSSTATGDSGGGRSPSTAMATIRAAIAIAEPPAIIRFNAGSYLVNSDAMGIQTHVVLKEGVSLLGGHNADFSVRDANSFVTTIQDMSREGKTQNTPLPNRAIEAGKLITTATLVEGFSVNGSSVLGVTHAAAVLTNGGSPTLRNNILRSGNANQKSYAIYNNGVSKGIIYRNVLNGGRNGAWGIFNAGSSPIVRDNTITATYGIENQANSEATLENNMIIATIYGIVNDLGHTIIRNNTITVNNNFPAYGIYNSGGALTTIENNIINVVTPVASTCISMAFTPSGKNPMSIKNNNMFGCSAVYRQANQNCAAGSDCSLLEMETNVTFGNGPATGNISMDPLFLYVGTEAYLRASSPVEVREGGLDLTVGNFLHDKDGKARTAIKNGLPTNAGASGWSMGAYEQD